MASYIKVNKLKILVKFLTFFTLTYCFFPLKKLEARYAAIVIDAASGQIIHNENPDKITHPASLTKMMTLYMVFSALDLGVIKLNTPIVVSSHASSRPPSKLGLKAGEIISVREAILGLVTRSANDAASAIAEKLGGNEHKFAYMMTEKARNLGMKRSVFKNASGLPNMRQVTTARDMATLARALIKKFPNYYAYFSTKTFHYKGFAYSNHNRLLGKVEGLDGIKTGFINASGFNLAASAMRNNRRLIGVVMGGNTSQWRDKRMVSLLENSFNSIQATYPVMSSPLVTVKSPLQISRNFNTSSPFLKRHKSRIQGTSVKTHFKKSRRPLVLAGTYAQRKKIYNTQQRSKKRHVPPFKQGVLGTIKVYRQQRQKTPVHKAHLPGSLKTGRKIFLKRNKGRKI